MRHDGNCLAGISRADHCYTALLRATATRHYAAVAPAAMRLVRYYSGGSNTSADRCRVRDSSVAYVTFLLTVA